ncbi:MAG: sulfotransferase [Spirochaetes bacterium]|nr:sulfotransferase [Spirochaetota bacterium]
MKPERFFIIGAMRSGTTYLATILDEHPEICMARPILPEPKFFLKDHEYSKGIEYYESKYFSSDKAVKVFGEKTVHYCEHEKAATRIRENYPDSKIIMILRNPVYRALSNYFFSKSNGLETRSLEQVFLDEVPAPDYDKNRFYISPFDYLKRGEYVNFIKLYEKYFRKEDFKILIMEKFIGNSEKVSDVFDFLGVDQDFIPQSLSNKIFSNDVDLTSISSDIIIKLKNYFNKYNELLEKHLNISLYLW